MLLDPRNWPAANLCLLAWLTVRTLSQRQLIAVGGWLGRGIARLRPDRALVADANLSACMPELSDGERDKLVRETIEATGMGLVESAMALWCTDRQLLKRFDIDGLEHLAQALEQGRGVIVLGAHYTCAELSGRLLAGSTETPVHMLARQNNQPWLERAIDRGRNRYYESTLEKKNMAGLIRVLRKNGVVTMASDQDFSYQAVFAPFFGVPASTVTSVANISRRTGARVLPMWCRRLDSGRYKMTLESPWPDFPVEDEVANATRINGWIESRVRACPAQYLWVHRRFKTRPPGEPAFYPPRARRQKDRNESQIMRTLYTIVMYLLTPVILYRLAWRGIRARAYFWRWKERFGFFESPGFNDTIWVHAVSVGEFNAAVPLINALMERYRDRQFVVTTVTPTGSERVETIYGKRVFHVYLPYDLPAAVRRFLDRVKPGLAVVMETEIWPNLFYACRQQNVPIVVANARLSERSLKGYRPVRSLAAMALNCSTRVAAQTRTDLERLTHLGGKPEILKVVGSLKFDLKLAPELPDRGKKLRQHWGAGRFVMVAGSTHEDDEVPLVNAFTSLLVQAPDALLVIAPRHPERFGRVVARCRHQGFKTAQRSVEQRASSDTQCFVVDTLGELMDYYAAADLAFVGGSLARVGGHNVLEPAALGVPVLVGPHTFNFSEITRLLLAQGGAVRVHNGGDLSREVLHLWRHPDKRQNMGLAALQLVKENKGALERTLELIEEAAPGGQPKLT